MYFQLLGQMKKQLRQVDSWFDKAEAHAKARGFDPNLLVAVRLAPDQFPLARQIDSTCDTAKLAASRLTGKDAPKNDDDEKTIAELRARVASAIAYLDTFTEKDFDGAATRTDHHAALGGPHDDGPRLLPRARAAELLLPPRPRLRDLARVGRGRGQARLPRRAHADQALKAQTKP
jgi:hypothetical protein